MSDYGLQECVLQEWVSGAGLKMQSILLSGLRAPDRRTVAVKRCVRWLRGQVQRDGDPAKQSYMQKIEMTTRLVNEAMEELEYLPAHYVHHFADAFAVLAYHVPDKEVSRIAYDLHELVAVELFHFHPETREEFLERHRDRV